MLERVYAQAKTAPTPPPIDTSMLDLSKTALPDTNWDRNFGIFLTYFLAVAAVAAFLGIIYSGFMMITSNGDVAQMAKAKTNLTWSVGGVIVISLAYVIVRFFFSFAESLR